MFKGGLGLEGDTVRDVPDSADGRHFETQEDAASDLGRQGRRRIVPVLMCGGAGTRLWPLSSDETPKQFHALTGEHSMFQLTLERLYADGRDELCAPIVITGARHAELVREQLAELGITPAHIVLEPVGRNTAPVAVIASMLAREVAPDAHVLLLPADHVIKETERLYELIRDAAALSDRIITFGVRPDRPETGYGYIRRGQRLDGEVFEIERFTEKPDLAKAESFLRDPDYCWNAGFFLFPPALLLAEMRTWRADVLD
ncbi:MAG TPA: sugar phosphate nucleotidyltransferase, partial [Phenylobacterium sp.]